MTITYTFQNRFLPKTWKSPIPPTITGDEQKDLVTTLEYRRIIAPYLRNWLDVLNTWRCIIKYCIIPLLILFLILVENRSAILILLLIVSLISFFICAKQRTYQRTAAIIQLVIDVVFNKEFGVQLPKILEDE